MTRNHDVAVTDDYCLNGLACYFQYLISKLRHDLSLWESKFKLLGLQEVYDFQQLQDYKGESTRLRNTWRPPTWAPKRSLLGSSLGLQALFSVSLWALLGFEFGFASRIVLQTVKLIEPVEPINVVTELKFMQVADIM